MDWKISTTPSVLSRSSWEWIQMKVPLRPTASLSKGRVRCVCFIYINKHLKPRLGDYVGWGNSNSASCWVCAAYTCGGHYKTATREQVVRALTPLFWPNFLYRVKVYLNEHLPWSKLCVVCSWSFWDAQPQVIIMHSIDKQVCYTVEPRLTDTPE